MTKRYCLKSLVAALLVAVPSILMAAPPDLTAAGVIAALKTDPDSTPVYGETYNLGPTGLRGWIYIMPTSAGGDGAEGTITTDSRQILVTVASTPGSAVLAVDDVILGAMAGSSGTVPSFTSDCRKAFGMAIGDAEKKGAGTLRVKRWRAGTTTDVNIPMTIMGNYTDTAPYSCPKSALILANARTNFVGKLLANPNYLTKDWAGAIHGLALLAGVAPGDANYDTVQTRLQTYARALAATTPNPSISLYMWDWGYIGLFLTEYYLVTGDANVVTGLNNYTVALAKVQSRYGTYNHTGSLLNADGSLHGTCPPYGPVNQIGIIANIAIVMGKKALVAAGQALDPEINPAIYRGTTFFAWFVNKGGIPYGEHEPNYNNHGSNGKDASSAVLFGLQAGRTVETEFFTRMAIAGFNGREYGHCGQGFSYLWGAMGANMGGSSASAEYLKQVRWHLDLERRTDGSFVYDGQEQYGAGSTANGTYLGESTYEGLNPTAAYILTYSLPLQRLTITGKNAIPANTLDSTKVAHAIASATFKQDSPGLTTTQLIAVLNDYDPVVRNIAASELAKRSLTPTETDTLIGMLASTDANSRQGACQTLGILQNATALPLITQRLNDPDVWVRAKAASAIRSYTSATASAQLTPMLTAFIANATDPEVIDWIDPVQISNRYLSLALFGNAIPDGSPGSNVAAYTKDAPKNLLYPAVRAGLKQPDSYPRSGAALFVYNRLSLADVQELALDIFEVITKKCQADPMWNYEPQLTGIKILQKFNCAEGLPMALSMLNVQEGWGWDSTTYLPPCMAALKTYGDLARWTRPTLNDDLSIMRETFADSDYTTVYPQMIDTISSISSAITSPGGLINLLPLATPQVVATTGAKSITLAGTSPRSSVTFTNVTSPAHGALTGTAPNLTYTPATGYTGPDSFTFQVADSLTTSDPGTVSIIVGTAGTGLKGEYFDNMDFTAPIFSRIDPQVNFDWGTGSPSNSISADTFSVRWSGQLLVPETGTYTFSTLNSDGVRLYLNGVQVIDDFMDQATHWKDSASISLTAGQLVELQMEYYENTGSAVAKLKWTGPSFAGVNGAIIAKEWLFDGTGATNRTPYAHEQRVTLVQNTAQTIMLQGSGGTLTYAVLTQPAHGTLTGTAPSLTYTPASNYTGSDSFTFRVNDGTSNSAPATVSIGIWAGQPVSYTWLSAVSGNWSSAGNWTSNAAPAATGQPYYSLDFTPDGTYTVTHNLNNGFQLNQLNVGSEVTLAGTMSLDFAANGSLLPQLNQNSANAVIINAPVILSAMTTFGGSGSGTVALTNRITGAGGLTKEGTGTLQLYGLNSNTYSGGTVINSGTLLLGLATDVSSPLCANPVGTGTVTLNSGTIALKRVTATNSLTVNGGTLRSENGWGATWSGAITLNAMATIDCMDSMTFSGDISGAGGLVKTDLRPLTLSGNNSYTGPNIIKAGNLTCSTAGALGSGGLIISMGGSVALNYTGTREVAWLSLSGTPMPNGTYGSTSSSAANKSDTYFSGTGTVTVNNSVPVASPQSVSTPEDIAKAITLTATDADGKPLTFIIVTQPAHGSLSGTPPTVTYTSAANYNGADSFTFKVSDGLTNSETATVSITVTPVNDAPAATPQSVATTENIALPITLAGTDAEGSSLTYAIIDQPAHGSLSGTPPSVTYTPTLNYSGSDSFTFKVNDGLIDSAPGTVSITVTDITPPTLARSDIVDNKSGGPIVANTLVTYTVTFNEDLNASTVTAADFGNAGTSLFSLGTIIETSPGVFSVQAMPTSAGTLIFKVKAGAELKNVTGLALDTASAILDDTTITVTTAVPSLTFTSLTKLTQSGTTFKLSVHEGNAKYQPNIDTGSDAVVTLGDGTLLDWKLLGGSNINNLTVNANNVGYANGAAAYINNPTSTQPDGITPGLIYTPSNWAQVWTAMDPGTDFSTAANQTTYTVLNAGANEAPMGPITGTVNISTLTTGQFYIFAGGYGVSGNTDYIVSLSGPGQTTLNASKRDNVGANNNRVNSVLFEFANPDGRYDTLTWTYKHNDSSNRGRFMGVALDGTIDSNPPMLISLTPADNATGVPVGINLVATFNENISIGTGNITIKNLTGGETDRTIAISDGTQVSVSGAVLTINPTADLLLSKDYAIQIDATAITDVAGNAFAGMTDDTTWNFRSDNINRATWISTATAGNWNTPDTTNWLYGIVGSGSGITADFNSVNLPADTTVTLTAPRTIGNLIFGDTDTTSAASWTLAGAAPNTLTLAGTTPTVTVNALGTAAKTTISAGVAGTAGLIKTGDGTLVLSGANTGLVGGNTSINAGTLRLDTSASALGSTTIQLGDTNGSATATLQLNTALTLTNTITVRAGSSGIKTIGISAAVTVGYSGTITANDDVTILQSVGTMTLSGTGNTIASGKTVLFTNATTANLYDSVDWSGLGKIAYGGSSGTIAIDGQKTHTGGATLNAMSGSGSIAVISSSIPTSGTVLSGPFGTGTLTINNTKLRATTNGDVTIGNAIIIAGDPTFQANSNEKNVILTGNADLGAATRTFNCGVGSTVPGKYVEFAGVISGSGSAGITKTGTGLLKLSGLNTYSGPTTISVGTLMISGAGQLGSGSYSGTITNNASFVYASSATQTLSGIISGTGTLTKSGTGTLLLNGANTFTGGTTITGGTLLVNGMIQDVTVNSGAVLAGTGTVARVTVASGGTLAPGLVVTAGTLSTSNLTVQAGGALTLRMGSSNDTVKVTGDLVLDGTITLLSNGSKVNSSTQLFTYTGSFSGTPTLVPPTGYVVALDTTEAGVLRVRLTATLPFLETFEDEPIGMASMLGLVDGQRGWQAEPAACATVQTNSAYAGQKAVALTEGTVGHPLSGVGATNVWFDFYIQPQMEPSDMPFPLEQNSSAAMYLNSAGKIVAQSGSAWLPPFDTFIAASNEWVRLTVKLNYATRKWELYAAHAKPGSASLCVARDLDFVTGSTNVSASAFSVTGDGPTPAYIDNLSFTTFNAILTLLNKGTFIQFKY